MKWGNQRGRRVLDVVPEGIHHGAVERAAPRTLRSRHGRHSRTARSAMGANGISPSSSAPRSAPWHEGGGEGKRGEQSGDLSQNGAVYHGMLPELDQGLLLPCHTPGGGFTPLHIGCTPNVLPRLKRTPPAFSKLVMLSCYTRLMFCYGRV